MGANETRRAADLAKKVEALGVRVRKSGDGYVAYPPDPEMPPVVWHRSPSDRRWMRNTVARMRRSGIDV